MSPVSKERSDFPAYNAVVGGVVALPCNVTPPTYDDGVSLVLWYRDDTGNPIYTVDARTTHLDNAKHFSSSEILGNRGVFNITYPMAYMRINPVKANDGGEYRCRVDYRRARTVNRILKLNVIVPVSKVVIYDDSRNRISDIAGPFNEDSSVNLTCESEGGNPSPTVKWWRGSALSDESYYTTPKGLIRNVIHIPKLTRDDLMMVLTCQASNTNLTVPATQTIAIDLNLKPKEVRIITPAHNMSAGDRVELVCQSSGSRPAAKINWWKGSTQIDSSGESTSDDGSVTTNFLTFMPSIDDNGKTLSCCVTNLKFPDFELKNNWTLNVLYAPILSLILGASVQHQEILEGSDVYFECNIQANPPVTQLSWLYNDQPLDSTTKTTAIEVKNNSLLIRNIGPKMHTGKYQCFAVNSQGKGESDVVNLKVKYPPICKSVQRVYYGVAKQEEARVECEVDADPSDVEFHWAFNNSANDNPDMISFVSEGKKSYATYIPRVDLDYGRLYCWAQNSAGKQREPCVFFVIEAGPPTPPDNCSLTNITAHEVTIECLPGYSGGLDQIFYLEVFSANPNRLLVNLSSTEYPFFIAKGLPAGYAFRLIVYSSNTKGKSKGVTITGNTLVAAHWQSDNTEDLEISPLLTVLMIVVGALIVLAIIIIMIMKIKSEEQLKHHNQELASVQPTDTTKTTPRSIMKKTSHLQNSYIDNKREGTCHTIKIRDSMQMREITSVLEENEDMEREGSFSVSNHSSTPLTLYVPPPPHCFTDGPISTKRCQLMTDMQDLSVNSGLSTRDQSNILYSFKHNHIIPQKEENHKQKVEIVVPVLKKRNLLDTTITEINDIDSKQYRCLYNNTESLNAINKIVSPASGGSQHDSGQEDDEECCNNNTPLMEIKRPDQAWVLIEQIDNSEPSTPV
ncbi:synaptogenesis protein syg-2-like [Oppia nitens]|uniref:synaptogenesis protein syg-2-like n=1 Tax=Oppia nitens TaxID=1686743 RepID=UPI0023DAEFB9|nr:synaptogenesis protein syg-2-like [Oppia nitens]